MSTDATKMRRDAAFRMEIGTSEEGAITDMIALGARLLIVKESAVYEIQTADRIDPARTNIKLPNSQQRLLSIGSKSPLLGRTALTTYRLFHHNKSLEDQIEGAMEISLNAASIICSMDHATKYLKNELYIVDNSIVGSKLMEGFILPSISNLESTVKSYLQNADHFAKYIIKLLELFYGNLSHAGSLITLSDKIGPTTEFGNFLNQISPMLKFVREARNAVEHPSDNQWVKVINFSLLPDGSVQAPALEIKYNGAYQEPIGIDYLFEEWLNELSTIFEITVAHLVAKNSIFEGFESAVIELADSERKNEYVRFSLALKIGGEWAPIS